jgi:preprotein translocase subunit SecG
MLAFFITLQIVVAVFMILVVLLQPGNKGGASAALGGAGSDTAFGGRGANTLLAKVTFGAAAVFMITNIALSLMSTSTASVLDKALPAQPAAPQPQ